MTRDCRHVAVIVSLPAPVAARLKVQARERGMTVPALARVLLADVLEHPRPLTIKDK